MAKKLTHICLIVTIWTYKEYYQMIHKFYESCINFFAQICRQLDPGFCLRLWLPSYEKLFFFLRHKKRSFQNTYSVSFIVFVSTFLQ